MWAKRRGVIADPVWLRPRPSPPFELRFWQPFRSHLETSAALGLATPSPGSFLNSCSRSNNYPIARDLRSRLGTRVESIVCGVSFVEIRTLRIERVRSRSRSALAACAVRHRFHVGAVHVGMGVRPSIDGPTVSSLRGDFF